MKYPVPHAVADTHVAPLRSSWHDWMPRAAQLRVGAAPAATPLKRARLPLQSVDHPLDVSPLPLCEQGTQ